MKNKAIVFILFASAFSLISCAEQGTSSNRPDSSMSSTSSSSEASSASSTEEVKDRSLDEMYEDLQGEIALSGDLLMRNYDSTGKEYSTDEGNMGVAFGTNSYYLTSNFFDSDITLWRGEDGAAVTYDLDRDNKIVENKFLDSSNQPISFDNYENPFLVNYKSYFSKDDQDKSYHISTESDINKSKIKQIMRRIANISLPDVNLFKMTYKDGKFDQLQVTTPKISTDSGSYDLTITLNFDLSSKDKDIPVPTPLKHETYHDTLLAAFDYLESGKYSYTMKYVDNSGDAPATYYYYEAVDKDFIFQGSLKSTADQKATMEAGYILVNDKENEGVDKGVHQLLIKKDGTYAYYSTVPQYNGSPIKDIKRYTPYRSVAIESFTKKDDGTYTMSTSQTGSLAYNITKYTNLDLSATSGIELTLNSDNKVATMHFISATYEAELTYDYSDSAFNKLGFKKEDLQAVDGYSLYDGTYKFKFKDEDVILIVSGSLKDPHITWNDKEVSFDGSPYFPTLNQIYFIYEKNSFYLKEATDGEGNVSYLVGCFDGPDQDEKEAIATRS